MIKRKGRTQYIIRNSQALKQTESKTEKKKNFYSIISNSWHKNTKAIILIHQKQNKSNWQGDTEKMNATIVLTIES